MPLRRLLQSSVRALAHLVVRANYRVEIVGGDAALSCVDGAIVVPRHVSRIDAPLLMTEAWPYARIRPTVWHAEYDHWLQRPVMKLFDAIRVGSPRSLPPEERRRRTEDTKRRMSEALAQGAFLMIFAEGGIGDGGPVVVPRELSGVYDLLAANPAKPVLLVDVRGLERSRFGKAGPKPGLFQRLDVTLTIRRFDAVSLEGGRAGLNERIERAFNEGLPL